MLRERTDHGPWQPAGASENLVADGLRRGLALWIRAGGRRRRPRSRRFSSRSSCPVFAQCAGGRGGCSQSTAKNSRGCVLTRVPFAAYVTYGRSRDAPEPVPSCRAVRGRFCMSTGGSRAPPARRGERPHLLAQAGRLHAPILDATLAPRCCLRRHTRITLCSPGASAAWRQIPLTRVGSPIYYVQNPLDTSHDHTSCSTCHSWHTPWKYQRQLP